MRSPLLAAAAGLFPCAASAASAVPQLDFGNPLTVSQVVWGGVIFGVFYVIMRNAALPAVASVLEERAKRIAADLDASRDAKAKSDAAVTELTEAIARARAEGGAAVQAAVSDAKARAAAQSAAQAETLDAQLRAADQRIAAARSGSVAAVRSVATETARGVIARLTGLSPDGDVIEKAVDRHLSQRSA